MKRPSHLKSVAIVLMFTFCQVSGMICSLSDLSSAEATPGLVAEGMACPMDGLIMCPPAAMSSPERQAKDAGGIDLEPTSELPDTATALTTATIPTPWSWSSAYSIVPISIASSSVLRI